ncbi:MAG: hypothetical protein FWF77_08020 [Defluviitaleaceae bacterium]|nr:hypothetical protein [Defluviitaleaceae bacterium]
MPKSAHFLEAGCNFPTRKKRVGECHSPTLFCKIKKARQARSEHRGHVSKSAHSLEAGNNFPTRKKVRQARSKHRGNVSKSTHSLEAGNNFPASRERVAAGTCPRCPLRAVRAFLFKH